MSYFRRQYTLPAEHGSWIWWIGPLAIGAAAAGRFDPDLPWLVAGLLAGFLLRQPATILVKALASRRPRADIRPAAVWVVAYGLAGLAAILTLATLGHARVLLLALPGGVVFVWHLWLVSRREERGQMGVEIVGAGVLALAAPAAYFVAGGPTDRTGWLLWILCWLQTAASILLVYYRLAERRLPEPWPLAMRLRKARRAFLYHAFNLLFAVALALAGWIPGLWCAGFGVMLADLVVATIRPAIGARPSQIGLRQLASSAAFTLLAAAGYLV
jgi:YwiC-like protein